EAFLGLKYLYTRNLRVLLKKGDSSWFDNITTKKNEESMEDIIKLSVFEGINAVFKKYGHKKENTVWGKVHTLTHPHLLGRAPLLNKIFGLNVGPFFSGGSDKTVRAGGFSYLDPFDQTAGASMRRIVDFTNLDEIDFILPTGQSGHPHSPHYKDQAFLYNKGKYKITHFNEDKIRKNQTFRKMILLPER
ncbi:uncharacterized protein METZ01_LOCUS342983, partial [marine metagenome]